MWVNIGISRIASPCYAWFMSVIGRILVWLFLLAIFGAVPAAVIGYLWALALLLNEVPFLIWMYIVLSNVMVVFGVYALLNSRQEGLE